MARPSRYHPLLVTLHWLLAVLIIAALALGALVMAPMPNTDPTKIDALRHHMLGGSLIVVLMLVRLAVRLGSSHPPAARTGSSILDRLAWASHRLFYVAVIGMAASGLGLALHSGALMMLFGDGGSLPADFWIYPLRTVHYALSRLLMGLISLHAVGALYHVFVLRDGLLKRMAFGRRFRHPRLTASTPNESVWGVNP